MQFSSLFLQFLSTSISFYSSALNQILHNAFPEQDWQPSLWWKQVPQVLILVAELEGTWRELNYLHNIHSVRHLNSYKQK